MDHNPWSAYNQHYSHLGAGGPHPQSPLTELRQDQGSSDYGGTDSTSSHHPLFLSTHPALGPSQADSSFNTMNLLSPNFDSPLLSSFQHSAKSHFSGLPPSTHPGSYFKTVSKDDLTDLRGGFSHRGQDLGLGAGSSTLFEPGNTWRPPLPTSSCGPFGILPHEAVMQNGEKQQQQRPGRAFIDPEMSRNYPGILPSPSRPPSFLDQNSVPHTPTMGSQGEYFNESYYSSCPGKSGFTPFNSSLSPGISSPSSVSQQNFPAYPVENKDGKTPGGSSTSMEPFSPNPVQLQGHNGQSSSSTSSSVSSRPGVIGTPGSTVCQNSPAPQHQASPHMPGYNQMQNYPYPSPSSQHSMSPSVVQSPQHQPQQDSRGLVHSQNFIGSNQASPSVHHSPYPAMNTPAPASTPAHITPPSSIGQAYCPILPENSPHCTSVITVTSCSSANFSSVPSMSPKDVPTQHIPPSSDSRQLDNAHYISGNMHKDMMGMVGMSSQRGCKNIMDSELSAIDAMVEKHQGPSSGLQRLSMPHGMLPGKPSMDMESMYHGQGMHNEYMDGSKDGMMDHHGMADTGIHPAIADFQTIPTARKRGRGRPRGSVNKRGRRARRSRRGTNAYCERDRYIPEEPISPIPEMEEVGGPLRNTYSSRLHISRAPHNRVFATRKDSMGYSMMEGGKPEMQAMRGAPHYMPLPHYNSDVEGGYQGQGMGGEVDDTKVFNFEEQATSEFTPYSKFMSQARGESSSHHLSQQHSHSMNSARAMMMDSCMSDSSKCQGSGEFLGVKAEVDDLGLLSPSLSSTSGSNQHQQHNELKQKNYLSIEDDLGFLAELPPIEPEPLASDPNGNKAAAKDPGGFLQSFLSFIEGSTEPSAADPSLNMESMDETGASSRGRRGAIRGRRGRGARGRSTGRRRGAMPGPERHSLDQRPYNWAGQNTTGLNDAYLGHGSLPPDPDSEYLEENYNRGNLHSDYRDDQLDSEYREIRKHGDKISGKSQKDDSGPNPEAPSFSSDDEDNTSGGIADSVAFVIRRLSEDEPPPPNGLKSEHKKKSVEQVEGSNHRKRSRKPKGAALMFQCRDSNGLKTKITLMGYKPKPVTKNETELDEPVTSPRRSTSMRKCKVETLKKREEKLKKKKEPEEGKPGGGNSSGDELEAESDTDPAWTPGSKPPIEGAKTCPTQDSGKRKPEKKKHAHMPQKLSLRFKTGKPINGENGNSGTPGVIHLLKEGKVYTRVEQRGLKTNGYADRGGGEMLLAPVMAEEKCHGEDMEEDSGNDSDSSSSGSSFKDESRSNNDQDDILQGYFRTGDFVISKTEVEICGAPLWQIEGKSLLQRFDTFEKDGRILYRNASTYSAWNPSLKNKFLGVTVRLLYSSRAYTIVEYLGLSSTDIPLMGDQSEDQLDAHPQRENFEVFLQTLISQVLDPNFITEILKENDDYFLSHLKELEKLTESRKCLLWELDWDYVQLKESAQLYPCLNLNTSKSMHSNTPDGPKCKLCQKEGLSEHAMEFYGQGYDPVTLSSCGPTLAASKAVTFVLCQHCTQSIVLYHRLHHHKYQFFLKCHAKVNLERSSELVKESHAILENCLQDTPWINEMFSEMQQMWSTFQEPR